MAAVIQTTQTFATGDQVTAGKLTAIQTGSSFAAAAVDNVTTQISGDAIIVKSGGIGTTQLADSNVTKAKIEDVSSMKVLGNVTDAATAPQEVSVLDEDDMSSDSNDALATQQSIKAYVDGSIKIPKVVSIAQGDSSNTLSWSGDQTNRTYTISELSIDGSTGFSGTLLGIYVRCRCDADFNESHLPFVQYDFPVLGTQIIFRHGSDGGSQGNFRRYETMFFLPVNSDQTTLVFNTEDDGDFVSVDILGASNLTTE
jgi:hypothetical protein